MTFRITVLLFAVAVLAASACAARVRGSSDPCVKNPSNSSCIDYRYPNDEAMMNVGMLCKMMPQMPVCSVKSEICNSSQWSSDPVCSAFGLWKLGCTDMPGMMGCGDYKSMCMDPQSVVRQCGLSLPPVPTTMAAMSQIKAICTDMPSMDGCSDCMKNMKGCDLLFVYSNLCKDMPDMSQCGDWTALCQAEPHWPVCA